MRVQTFMAKVGMESLKQMDQHINDWLAKTEVEPKFINQSFGSERHRQANVEEPVLIVQLWY